MEETSEILVYKCGYCGKIYRTKESADLCHSDRTCVTCGKVIGKKDYYSECESCRNKKSIEKELERFSLAEKLTIEQYDDKYPNHMIIWNDEFYYIDDLDMLLEDYLFENPEDKIPKYVWGTEEDVLELDPYSIIENFEENSDLDEFSLDKEECNSIKDFCKEWNSKYSSKVYRHTNKVAVLLRETVEDDTHASTGLYEIAKRLKNIE